MYPLGPPNNQSLPTFQPVEQLHALSWRSFANSVLPIMLHTVEQMLQKDATRKGVRNIRQQKVILSTFAASRDSVPCPKPACRKLA